MIRYDTVVLPVRVTALSSLLLVSRLIELLSGVGRREEKVSVADRIQLEGACGVADGGDAVARLYLGG